MAVSLIEKFLEEHARIDAGLKAAEAAASDTARLTAVLKSMRVEVIAHFKAKDALYPALAEQAMKANDPGAAQLTRIFEANMKVQSAAVQRFFETLDTAPPSGLANSFRTLALVIRQRFGTEEKAVFPLYTRTAKALESA